MLKRVLKHLKIHFVNMCTKYGNSKIFYIVMILFAVIGFIVNCFIANCFIANCFNQSDIAMRLMICVVIGIDLMSIGIGFEIQQVSEVLTGQDQEKISKDKVKESDSK